MRGCLSSTSFVGLVNGNAKGLVKATRGLKQCDPLSSFLFTIVMDALSRMMIRAEENGLSEGFMEGIRRQADFGIHWLIESRGVWIDPNISSLKDREIAKGIFLWLGAGEDGHIDVLGRLLHKLSRTSPYTLALWWVKGREFVGKTCSVINLCIHNFQRFGKLHQRQDPLGDVPLNVIVPLVHPLLAKQPWNCSPNRTLLLKPMYRNMDSHLVSTLTFLALGKAWVLHEVMSKDTLFTNFDLPWMRYRGDQREDPGILHVIPRIYASEISENNPGRKLGRKWGIEIGGGGGDDVVVVVGDGS
ncbi:hypothetical protein CK203_051382 [Vitis vinifera]|uniref:Reverse transcriptase domain-containing protein n=1 Tax=Vitis vinifera TaxID=29760 RepID=A0A438FLZ7_VITVI|nr:hypothetical protein CK203_051382 [Vitis vinifera]